jgi:hypothetical protein
MSLQSIALQTIVSVSQNTATAFNTEPGFPWEYALYFKCTDPAALFANASYRQNGADANEFDVNLSVDGSAMAALLNTNVDIVNANTNSLHTSFNGLTEIGAQSDSIGQRLLEIMAIKLFANANARAAIVNDSEFTGAALLDSIVNSANHGIGHSFTTDAKLVFNQYVGLGRIANANDVDQWVNFNFVNVQLEVPMYLSGLVAGVNDMTGPASVGGVQVQGGAYTNIPILLVLDGTNGASQDSLQNGASNSANYNGL